MSVKVYSTTWCPFCHALMDWLDHINVKYTVIDAEKLLQDSQSEIQSVPAIAIEEELIFGFDRPAITKALKKANLIPEPPRKKSKKGHK